MIVVVNIIIIITAIALYLDWFIVYSLKDSKEQMTPGRGLLEA